MRAAQAKSCAITNMMLSSSSLEAAAAVCASANAASCRSTISSSVGHLVCETGCSFTGGDGGGGGAGRGC